MGRRPRWDPYQDITARLGRVFDEYASTGDTHTHVSSCFEPTLARAPAALAGGKCITTPSNWESPIPLIQIKLYTSSCTTSYSLLEALRSFIHGFGRPECL